MEMLLLALYALIIWLIFFKFRCLPWTPRAQAIVFTIPVVGLATLILLLNVYAPSSADVRVIKPVVPIVSQVRGRVISVDVAPNQLVRKGSILFSVDPTPYRLKVDELEAQLVAAQSQIAQLQAQLQSAQGQSDAVAARLALAQRRATEIQALESQGAADRFSLEQAQATLLQTRAELQAAQATVAQTRALLNGKVRGQPYQIAEVSAQLADARWDLQQTVVRAPADGYAINLQLRPGSFVGSLPISPVLSFVENQQQVIALYQQNELYAVQAGNRAEFTLRTLPGRIIHAHVRSIVWAQSQGQLLAGGAIPSTGLQDPGGDRFAVRLDIDARDQGLFLAAGAVGDGAIYTDGFEALHLVRMVLLRISAKLNYLVLKLH